MIRGRRKSPHLSGAQPSLTITDEFLSLLPRVAERGENTLRNGTGRLASLDEVFQRLNGVKRPNDLGIVCARATSGAFDERKRKVPVARDEPGQLPLHGM